MVGWYRECPWKRVSGYMQNHSALTCHVTPYATMRCSLRVRLGDFLTVQWLGLHTSTAAGTGSIPGQGTKILHAARCGTKKNKDTHTHTHTHTHLCTCSKVSGGYVPGCEIAGLRVNIFSIYLDLAERLHQFAHPPAMCETSG